MKLVCKRDFTLGDKYYEAGDEVEVTDKAILVLLNEKGFIKPLTRKEIENFGKEEKNISKEEL